MWPTLQDSTMTNSTPNPHDKTTWTVRFLQHTMDHHHTPCFLNWLQMNLSQGSGIRSITPPLS